ncbi:DUF3558 domain-containing protein [Nocardia miyunensis]|uniref:DUF3558 domain-containing protein n=1 Tax=Nocardia miyunensis TaxID=282684 RepID=UPI0009FF10A2|nr:DUF3558 domain-containing protein [Nocardia miyunensis]
MTNWGKVIQSGALGIGAVLLVASCNSGGSGSDASKSASATPTVAADVPAFDPCKDIPQSVLDKEKLINPDADKQDGDGGIKWRGCGFIQENGYSATIDSTNITLSMVRTNHDFNVIEELTVGGRAALTSHVADQDPRADCAVNVEMKGGTLEISIDNPPSAPLTGTQNSCDIAKRLAGEIVTNLPAGS